MTTDKDACRLRESGHILIHKVAYHRRYARSAESARVLFHQFASFLAYLKCHHVNSGVHPLCLNGYAARTETDIPQHTFGFQSQRLDGEKTYGHLGYHFGTAIEDGKGIFGDTCLD